MRIKRILHISPLPVWTMNEGAGMPSVYQMLKVFDDNGIEQHYVHITDNPVSFDIGSFKKLHYSSVLIPSQFSIFRTTLPYFLDNKKNILYYSLFLPKKLRGLMDGFNPDCVYSHLSQMAYPVFLAAGTDYPLFIRLFGSIHQYKVFTGQMRFYKNKENFLPFRLPACGFIMVNDGTGSDMIASKMGVNSERILHMHNGTDMLNSDNSINIRKVYNIPDDYSVGLFINRFTDLKGIDELVEIIRKLRHEKIFWILIGEGNKRKPAMDCLREDGINNVVFPGSIRNRDLGSYLLQADFFVSLASYSVLINPVLEALRAHLPVFAINTGYGTDFLKKILFLSETASGLSMRIKSELNWLNRDSVKYNQYTKECSLWEKENLYSWEYRYKKEIDFIESRVTVCGKT